MAFGSAPLSAASYKISLETSIGLPQGQRPQHIVGDLSFRDYLVTYDLLPEVRNPIVVIARDREVWYVDGLTLDVLQRLKYGPDQSVVVSPNGRYLAVYSSAYNRKSGKTFHSIQVDDWTGRECWKAPLRSSVEPTSRGGLLSHVSGHPAEAQDTYSWPEPNEEPQLRPHPLVIYDDAGRPVLEGVDYSECRYQIKYASMSPDGRYLAYLFRWIPEENRESRGHPEQDRACLVLYDIDAATEMWRHYFDGRMPASVTVGPSAQRILCFVATTEVEGVSPPMNYAMFLFDDAGGLITKKVVAGCDSIFSPNRPVLSADGKLCCFNTHDSRVYVIKMEDGAELWHWPSQGNELEIQTPSVANDGSVVAFGSSGNPRAGTQVIEAVFFDSKGNLVRELSAESPGDTDRWIGVSGDGGSFWVADAESLRLYRVAIE